MNINCTHLTEKSKNYKERGNASFEDNINYLSNGVSHVEILRYQGAGEDMMYVVVAKAKTINVITGDKSFVVWARQEDKNIADALQKACDEFRNRIVMGFPVEHEVGVLKHDTEYQEVEKLYNVEDIGNEN